MKTSWYGPRAGLQIALATERIAGAGSGCDDTGATLDIHQLSAPGGLGVTGTATVVGS